MIESPTNRKTKKKYFHGSQKWEFKEKKNYSKQKKNDDKNVMDQSDRNIYNILQIVKKRRFYHEISGSLLRLEVLVNLLIIGWMKFDGSEVICVGGYLWDE